MKIMAIETKISKTLSYWLRHKPEVAGLELDAQGWTSVAAVLEAMAKDGLSVDRTLLDHVVADNNKQRFEYSSDGMQIRARQGHSVSVELHWPLKQPPDVLYHGTVERFLPAILDEGLRPMARHHVHLSPDIETARNVGSRRGQAIILEVDSNKMAQREMAFFLTDNGVWLTEAVPPRYLKKLEQR
jgi:putative RNA 2'-phosphotransferase